MTELKKIIKNNHLGQEVWRYPGKLLIQSQNGLLFEARFNRSDFDFNGLLLKKNDLFLELYLYKKHFNIYQIYDRDTKLLKAWYCNICRPVVVENSTVSYDDLALDLLVFQDGRKMILDEDEFTDLGLADDLKQAHTGGWMNYRRFLMITIRWMSENCSSCYFEGVRRKKYQKIQVANNTSRLPIAIGATMESTESVVEVASSAMLMGILPLPPVIAVTAGRTAAVFTVFTTPATRIPKAKARIGLMSVITLVLAANTIAPAVGRTNVCITKSLT